ncbi:MAG: hypothetical protein HY306_05940 [Nitrosomonadales bacterium]|nr:hypothetical protein [Nitrosomonadales bacterium]
MNTETKEEGAAVQREVDRVISAARDSLTDEMVGRLAGSAAEALDLVDKAGRAGLGKAIPALAEMVNNGDLERVAQLARVYHASQDALTDEMVGRLSDAVGGGLSLLDQVNRSGLDKAIPIISRMAIDGDLERLSQLARVYSSAQDALTDEMVGRLAETLGEGLSLLDRVNRSGAGRLVEMLEHLESTGALERIANTLPQLADRLDMIAGLMGCMESAASKSREHPAAGGVGSMWRMMTDEKTARSLQFLIEMSDQMQQHCAKPR